MNAQTSQRISGAALAVTLLLTLTTPATAEIGRLDEIGAMGGVLNLGALVKQALRGEAPEGVIVEKLDSGFLKIAIPLREDSPVLRQKLAKDLINCAITVELFEPDLFADLLTFDVAPIDGTDYFAGWVTLNTSANDVDATSTLKTKGPGPDVNVSDTLTYSASAFNLFFVPVVGGWAEGLHSADAKVKGAKPAKLKTNFCAGCT